MQKGTPFKLKQKLSPSAAKKKAKRDLAAANTSKRAAFRAESQKKRYGLRSQNIVI